MKDDPVHALLGERAVSVVEDALDCLRVRVDIAHPFIPRAPKGKLLVVERVQDDGAPDEPGLVLGDEFAEHVAARVVIGIRPLAEAHRDLSALAEAAVRHALGHERAMSRLL